jgi:hypothetical protein
MPLRRNLLRSNERAHLIRIRRRIEYAPVPRDDGYDEQRARQVAQKSKCPMPQHHRDREAAMQYRDCRELYP